MASDSLLACSRAKMAQPYASSCLSHTILLAPGDEKRPSGLHLQLLHSVVVAGILQPYHSVSMPILLNAAMDSWRPPALEKRRQADGGSYGFRARSGPGVFLPPGRDPRAFGAGAFHRTPRKTPRTGRGSVSVSPFWSLPTHHFLARELYKFHMPAIAGIAITLGTRLVLGFR